MKTPSRWSKGANCTLKSAAGEQTCYQRNRNVPSVHKEGTLNIYICYRLGPKDRLQRRMVSERPTCHICPCPSPGIGKARSWGNGLGGRKRRMRRWRREIDKPPAIVSLKMSGSSFQRNAAAVWATEASVIVSTERRPRCYLCLK